MARVTIEDCLKRIPNRFELSVLVAKRARQLLKGDTSLVSSKNKHVVTALREVEEGRVDFKDKD